MEPNYTKSQPIFYKNQPATFLADFGDECAIEVGYDTCHGDESHIEYGKMIVLKRQLSTSQMDFDKEFDKLNDKLRLMEAEKIREVALRVKQKDIEYIDLVQKLKKIEPIKQLMEYLDGNSKYAIIKDYSRYELLEISELATDEDGYWNKGRKLKAFVLDRNKNNKFEFTISASSDGSGATVPLFLFDNKEDAVKKYTEFLKEMVLKDPQRCVISSGILKLYGIEDADLWANVEIGEKNKVRQRLEEFEKKRKELETLRINLGVSK